jgi:TRAP-type mannitol/chloroaromatic compound transport system substrate-binding protein
MPLTIEQVRRLIMRAVGHARDDYVRENEANLRSALKLYESRKSPRHQQLAWDEVKEYAWRLEKRLDVLEAAKELTHRS